ncbi:MAG TPA: hypothetical protein VHF89_02765 [Solirubrobacteraceae bacterium]|nr:hypothetical protein [Solirubrobacteraceae bacterium]
MIQTGHGRPLGATALGALVLIVVSLAVAPGAHARLTNVIPVDIPRPAADEVSLVRVEARMSYQAQVAGLGDLPVRVTGRLPRGFAVAGVRARPRGDTAIVRLVAVRTTSRAPAGRDMRIRLRIGSYPTHVYRHALMRAVRIGPSTRVRRPTGCATIVGESARWRVVRRAGAIGVDGVRYGARTVVAAAQQLACDKRIPTVSSTAMEQFLTAVDPDFAASDGSGAIEGFYATWAKAPDGSARICVYVRGDRGGSGNVTVASTFQEFTLDDDTGVTRVDTAVPGEGEYAFVVRWRQPDGSFRESESTLRVPGGGTKGQDPPAPYSAAGPCG